MSIEIHNTEETRNLIKKRVSAFGLLAAIATLVKPYDQPKLGLKKYQCYINAETSGATGRIYRTDKLLLERDKLATFSATNKGTTATLLVNPVITIRLDECGRADDKQSDSLSDSLSTTSINTLTSINYKEREYLLSLPSGELKEFVQEFKATEKQVQEKAVDLFHYCTSKNKKYANYRSFLRNALKRDFGVREEKTEKVYKLWAGQPDEV